MSSMKTFETGRDLNRKEEKACSNLLLYKNSCYFYWDVT